MKKSTRETLKAARSLLAQPGRWTQLAEHSVGWFTGRDSYCSVGAIKEVAPSQTETNRAMRALARVIDSKSRYTFAVIVAFNDAENRRKHEVLEVFDKAIKRAK